MSEKTRAYIITNIGALVAMIVVVINMFTFREMWILFTAVAVMIVLVAYAYKRNVNLKGNKHKTYGRHSDRIKIKALAKLLLPQY